MADNKSSEGDVAAGGPSDPLRGVSVHHLSRDLLDEVRGVGLGPEALIYEIEPLVIRPRGEAVQSPRSGKPGASYAAALNGADHAGRAQYMLSYTWGYSVGDIVSALVQHCGTLSTDPKRVYVWICCLCINQHRVQEARAAGETVPFEEFQAAFGERVQGTGNVLALMMPWSAPRYITRAWCVFELFTAMSESDSCCLTVIMPPDQASSLCNALEKGSHSAGMWEALEQIHVEHAEASVSSDLERILKLVEAGPGFRRVNDVVKERLLQWFAGAVNTELARLLEEGGGLVGERAASVCAEVVGLLLRVGHLERATVLVAKARGAAERGVEGDIRMSGVEGANLLRVAGRVCGERGDRHGELKAYSESEALLRRLGKLQSHDGAAVLTCHASALERAGDLQGALQEFGSALAIREAIGSANTLDGADLLAMLGQNECKAGMMDAGLAHLRQAVDLFESLGHSTTPAGAKVLTQLANAESRAGHFGCALQMFEQAKSILQSVGALQTPQAAALLLDFGMCQDVSGRITDSLATFTAAQGILESIGMQDSALAADVASSIAFAKGEQGDKSGRFQGYEAAFRIRESLGDLETTAGALLLTNLGYSKGQLGDISGELRLYAEARRVREATDTLETLAGVTLLTNIGGARLRLRDRAGAMEALQRAKEICQKLGMLESSRGRNVLRYIRWAQNPMSALCVAQ